MFYLRAPCSADRDHVEPHSMLTRAIAACENSRGTPNLLLLAPIDRLSRRPRGNPDAALDLDEHQRLPVHRDQVDFRSGGAKISRQDSEPLALQVPFRKPLALLADRESGYLAVRSSRTRKPKLVQQVTKPS